MMAPYIDHKGAISDEEALMIQTTIDNFREAGYNYVADVIDASAADRVRKYGAGSTVPLQPSIRGLITHLEIVSVTSLGQRTDGGEIGG